MRASFGASVRGLRKNKNVFFDDAKYKQVGNAGFDKNEESRFEAIIRMAEGSAYKAGKFVDLLKKNI